MSDITLAKYTPEDESWHILDSNRQPFCKCDLYPPMEEMMTSLNVLYLPTVPKCSACLQKIIDTVNEADERIYRREEETNG